MQTAREIAARPPVMAPSNRLLGETTMIEESSVPPEKSSPQPSRRRFLQQSTAAVAAGSLVGTLGSARQAHAAANNDEIKIAVIGCGGRGTGAAINALDADKNTRIVALADVFDFRVRGLKHVIERQYKSRVDVPEDRQFVGLDAYRKALATDCDLVLMAAPPGFRPIHFEAAVKAGKHVFMEKPVATDPAGVRRILAAGEEAKRKNLLVQVGLQRRHERRYQEIIKRVQDGAIGDVLLTRAYWNGTTPWVRPRKPGQTELEYQIHNWYFFNWIGGDHIVEQHIHNLDVINWLKNAYPVKANGMGGREVRTGMDHGQIFDHHFVEFTYADGSKMYSQCRHMDGTWTQVAEYAHGTKGTANLWDSIYDEKGKRIAHATGGNGHQTEHDDLFPALRRGDRPNEAEYGALSTMTAIFGRMATYSGQELNWDACLNSQIDLGVKDFMSFDETPPVLPDANGRYPVPVPGKTRVV